MGTEIGKTFFDDNDWAEFSRRLSEETELLGKLAASGEHSRSEPVGGFEIEAWLCDAEMRPLPMNAVYLERLNSDMATMELAKFNFELNNTPRRLTGNAFGGFAREMHRAPAAGRTPWPNPWASVR